MTRSENRLVGERRRRLLGEDDLSEKQQKSEGAQNVHRRVFRAGWSAGQATIRTLKGDKVFPNTSACSSSLCFRSSCPGWLQPRLDPLWLVSRQATSSKLTYKPLDLLPSMPTL